jgi:hypothetical protein
MALRATEMREGSETEENPVEAGASTARRPSSVLSLQAHRSIEANQHMPEDEGGVEMKLKMADTVTAGLVGAALLVVSSCAQAPTEQFETATKAVDAAKAAGAPEYAKEDFTKLEQQFALAKEEMAKQDKAFPMFRSYAEANKLLVQVVTTGQQVEALAAQKKDAAKTAAMALETEAQQVLAAAQALAEKAPTGKERAGLEALKQDLPGLQGSLGHVHQLIEKGDYLGADVQAKAIKEKGAAVSVELEKAMEKAKGPHRKASA